MQIPALPTECPARPFTAHALTTQKDDTKLAEVQALELQTSQPDPRSSHDKQEVPRLGFPPITGPAPHLALREENSRVIEQRSKLLVDNIVEVDMATVFNLHNSS